MKPKAMVVIYRERFNKVLRDSGAEGNFTKVFTYIKVLIRYTNIPPHGQSITTGHSFVTINSPTN